MIQALLSPFELLYAAGVRVRNARYDRESPCRLQWPVISVGNLSVGGTGKTPFVIYLARLLAREGFYPVVLSRGHGRAGRQTERVSRVADAVRFGDEPCLIAQSAGVPVFVGASRYEAGLLAEREITSAGGIHLLDDGFQHRQLARQVDIVLVQCGDLEDRLLPAGRMREPLASLKRADVIVLRAEDAALEERLLPYTRGRSRFWRIRRHVAADGITKRAIAFCGIARPAQFFRSLQDSGMELAKTVSFRDHHRYTERDILRLRSLGERHGCDAFLTTEKDAIKIDAGLRRKLSGTAPLRIVRMSVELEDEDAALQMLRSIPGVAVG